MACSYRYNSRLLGSSETAEAAEARVPEAVSAVTESGGYARKRRRYMTSSSSTGLEEQKVSITSSSRDPADPHHGSLAHRMHVQGFAMYNSPVMRQRPNMTALHDVLPPAFAPVRGTPYCSC